MNKLNEFFESYKVPRIRVGEKQTIETVINEEALLLAKFLRYECSTWLPRIRILKAKTRIEEVDLITKNLILGK